VRRAATRSQCANNLKQIGIAAHNHRDATGHFPPGTVAGTQLPPELRLSFYAPLLPYLEKPAVYNQLKLAEPWDAEPNRLAVEATQHGAKLSWHLFQCGDWTSERWYTNSGRQEPYQGHDAFTNYVGVAGVGADAATRPAGAPGVGMFGYDRTLKVEQVKDGLANTLLLIETGHEVGPWLRGGPTTVRAIDPNGGHLTGDGLPFGGTHFLDSTVIRKQKPDGFHVVLGDGSVRYVKNEVHPEVLIALATIAGGEEIPGDW
jgi:Protein of unknown function (DUF1559)